MNAPLLAPSVFESFNARALAPALVARTFVPSLHFDSLAKRAHSLVIGPRGSGKTTLLKMLHPSALESWKHEVAEKYRRTIDFTGVFIGTDYTWGKQVEALGKGMLSTEHQALFGVAAFTTHVLRALVKTMHYRTHSPADDQLVSFRRSQLSATAEAKIVEEVSTHWFIRPNTHSFLSLQLALSARLGEIYALAAKEILLPNESRSERLASHDVLHLHFISAAVVLIEAFNNSVGCPEDRWAFLVDEFELAPGWIRTELLRAMRTSDDRLLFKLSMSPFNRDVDELGDALSAMPGNDYSEIPLWFAHKEDGYPFCEALFHSMMRERELEGIQPDEVFGRSVFETAPEEWSAAGTAYRLGSQQQKRLERMSKKDATFRTYLETRGIDPAHLETVTGDKRAADLRKVVPLLAIREAFRGADAPEQPWAKKRSRKNPGLYSGAKALFAMVEGNPRWFIGIIGELLDDFVATRRVISPTRQSRSVQRAANRFQALLATKAYLPKPDERFSRGLLDVLQKLGDYLFKVIVLDAFNPDPPGSFTVDAECDSQVEDMLTVALNAGAIVYVPNSSAELVLKSLQGKRFRLSYLLAPKYGLPLRLGREVALSMVLSAPSFSGGHARQQDLL